MDEGSYNIYGGRSASPMTPSTPGSNAFKTDIHRMKTRKWVEAKPQSYDGDDWGNDYDDDEPEQPPSPPKPTARVFSQPAAAAAPGNRELAASDLRSPSGPPALHIQTQQPTPALAGAGADVVSGPSSLGSASERGHLEHIVSPQSAGLPPLAPSAHTYPGRPQYHSTSPAPESASNEDTNVVSHPAFGQDSRPGEKPENTDSTGFGAMAHTEPTPSVPPVAEQTLVSPRQSAATPTKPLPFVRPSDIYRRMEEEKEKERRSMESGRPSLDSTTQARSDRSASPAKDMRPPLDQRGRVNPERDELQDTSQDVKPVLAPVPETSPEQTPHEGRDVQRPSASPQLPAVARMSGFGAGMFSSTTDIGLQDPSQMPLQESLAPNDTPQPSARPSRPSIPGGWVSETTNLGSETETPMETPGARPTPLSAIQVSDAVAVLPANPSDHEQDDIEPTTTIKQAPSLDSKPKPIAKIQAKHEACGDEFGAATGRHDKAVAHEVGLADVGTHPTTKNLPPLQTGGAVPTPARATPVGHDVSKSAGPPYQDSPSNYSASTQQSTSAASHVTPTAPLNPHRGDVSASESVQPGVFPRNLTMSTTSTGSPINENDRLQRDIIRSLSPMNSPDASGLLPPAGSNETGMTRESRYLSGVYDDYLGSSEEKPRQPGGEMAHNEVADPGHRMTETPPAQAGTQQPREPLSDVASVSTEKTPTPEPQHPQQIVRRRFSWEMEPDNVTLSPVAESKTEVSGPELAQDKLKLEHSEPVQPVSADQAQESPAPDSVPPMGHDGHDSEADSHSPELEHARIESPSPLSATSERRTSMLEQSTALTPGLDTGPAESEDRHLSLAEEKGLFQTSSQPVSPSPPQDDHPALSRPSAEAPSPVSSLPPSSPSNQQYHLITWQEILSLPTSNQRVQRFEEAREQFQAMDSGLSNWMRQMGSQSEHAGLLGMPQGGMPIQASSTSMPLPTQRQTEASNPNIRVTSPGAGRTSSGNLLHGFQQSNFGGSTSRDRVGAKSKELLHSAGAFGNKATKSGMKLLSKGKNKLRGTGDKESALPKTPPPPTVPAKASAAAPTRNERRSWGISSISALGARSAAAIRRAPHHVHLSRLSLSTPPKSVWGSLPATRDGNASSPILSSGPPQLPPPVHISPFNSVSRGGHSTLAQQPRDSLPLPPLPAATATSVSLSDTEAPLDGRYHRQPALTLISTPTRDLGTRSPTSAQQVSGAGNQRDRESNHTRGDPNQLSIPAPISKHQPTFDPFTSPPLVEEEAPSCGELVSPQHSSPLPSASHDVLHLTTDGKSDGSVKVVTGHTSSPDLIGSLMSSSAKMTVPPIADRQAAPQQGAISSAPARQSSFVGLPPIRRMSTFHMKNPQKRWGGVLANSDSPPAPGVDEQIPEVPPLPADMLHQAGNVQALEQQHYMQQSGQGFAQNAPQNPGPGPFTNGRESFSPSAQHSSGSIISDPRATYGSVSPLHTPNYGPSLVPQHAPIPHHGPSHDGPQPPFIGQTRSPPLQTPSSVSPGLIERNTPPLRPTPVSRFPQGQWKLEESHLAQPLHIARNRSSTNGPLVPPLPGYYAYDKETGVEFPARQDLARNQSVPPVSAQRFPELFPAESSGQSQGSAQHERFQSESPGHDSPSVSRPSTRDFEERGKRHSGFFEEIGGRFLHRDRRDSVSSLQRDDASFSSEVLPGEHRQKKKRRSLLGLGGLLADDNAQEEHQQPEHPHKERSFSGLRAFSKHKHDVDATDYEIRGTTNGPQQATHSGNLEDAEPPSRPKKRFSDLKGLLRGDSKDRHQRTPHATLHLSRPSTQGFQSALSDTGHRDTTLMQGTPQLGQPNVRDRPGQIAQPGTPDNGDQAGQVHAMAVPPQSSRENDSRQVFAQPPLRAQSPALPVPSASQVVGETETSQERGSRRASAVLGGLFGNRPAKIEQQQSTSSLQLPRTQAEMHPEQVPRPKQPATGSSTRRSSQGMPMPQGSSQEVQSDTTTRMPTASVVEGSVTGVRQPSTSSVHGSSDASTFQPQRPVMPPTQRSRTDPSHPLGSHPVYPASESGERSLSVSKQTVQLSQLSSHERLSVSGASFIPRASPARKPVGSAPSRPRKKSVASLQPSLSASEAAETAPGPGSKATEPSSVATGSSQAARQLPSPAPSPVPSTQKTPQLAAPAPAGPVQQLSLPSPSHSPTPTPLTPSSDGSGIQRTAEKSFQSLTSPQPPVSPHSPVSSAAMSPDRRASRQSLGQVQDYPGQPGQGVGPNAQEGGPRGLETQPRPFFMQTAQQPGPPAMNASVPLGPQYLAPQAQGPWRPQSIPGEERHKSRRLSKLFGGSKKDSSSHHTTIGTIAPPSQKTDEKEGGSKKLLNVFKRSSKQMTTSSADPGFPGQRSPSVMSIGPGPMPGQQAPPHVWQQGGGPQIPRGLPPQGFFPPALGQPHGAMQGGHPIQQRPPPMQGGRGQHPPQQQWPAGPHPQAVRYGPAPNGGRGFEGPVNLRAGMPIPYDPRVQAPGEFPPQSDPSLMRQPPSQLQHGQTQAPMQQGPDSPFRVAQAPQSHSTPQQLMAQRIMAQQPVAIQQPSEPSRLGATLQGMALHASDILHRPQPQHIVTRDLQNQPHIQHPGSPQSYPLPESADTLSPLNPAAARLPNPPLPPSESLGTRNMIDENLSRSVSNVSYPQHHPPAPAHIVGQTSAQDIPSSDPSRNSSLSPDAPVERAFSVSPERRTPSPDRRASSSASDAGEEHIDTHPSSASSSTYGRHTPKGQDHDSPVRPDLAPHHDSTSSHDVATTFVSPMPVRTSSSVYNSTAGGSPGEEDSSQQATPPKDSEEKILVDQPVELSAVNDDDDSLIMSATSYPGQEWNPYAAGEFGYYED